MKNRPNNFKIYFIPEANNLLKFEAPIIQILSNNTYRIKVPEMPYDGIMTFDIVPTQNANLFVQAYERPQFYVSKIPNVKLSALDGTAVVWNDGTIPSVMLKVETTNSENLSWNGRIVGLNTSNEASLSSNSKLLTPWIIINDGNIFKLSGIENECGYGISSGTVTIKHCYQDLLLLNYFTNNPFGEFYSNSHIISNVLNNYYSKIKLYSAKKSIELLPGFKTDDGQTFVAEIKGCEVVR